MAVGDWVLSRESDDLVSGGLDERNPFFGSGYEAPQHPHQAEVAVDKGRNSPLCQLPAEVVAEVVAVVPVFIIRIRFFIIMAKVIF